MPHRRHDDPTDNLHPDLFYTDRYFNTGEGWYYYARGFQGGESFVVGPFIDKDSAIKDCEQKYIRKSIGHVMPKD